MTTERRNEIKKEYYKKIKDMFKPEALKWIDEVMFQLDMIDRWDLEERTCYEVLIEIRKELLESEVD